MARPTVGGLLTTLDADLRDALQAAEQQVRLASPFIGGGTALSFCPLIANSNADWQLLTRLDPVAAAYGSLSLRGLKELLDVGVELRHLDRLHAKLFLADNVGFLGSANLTDRGLGSIPNANHELTVALGLAQRGDAEKTYDDWFEAATPVNVAMIDDCARRAAEIPVRLPSSVTSSSDKPRDHDRADALLRRASDVNVWIKAIYRDEVTADEPWRTGSWISGARKPTFAIGDLIVIYAVDAKACNAVLRVDQVAVSDPQRLLDAGYSATDAKRWQWVTDATCELQVPIARGVPLSEFGIDGRSLQGGHCRMPVGGLPAALRYMTTR